MRLYELIPGFYELTPLVHELTPNPMNGLTTFDTDLRNEPRE
jgi:hypothetical protein